MFLGSFLLFAGTSAITGIPVPRVHDEFSYLLAGNTFTHGRLANPPHPLWQHFETFHVIQTPNYQSKYPPAQGFALALGQLLGHPIAGVWLSTAAACAALFWCLARWLPLRWAVAGIGFVALHPLVLRWSQCYWGGSVALLGGALVVGAMRSRNPAVAAAGAVLLANSRPYEGLILVILAAPFLLRRRYVLIAAAVLAAGFLGMGFYNDRVTGHALRLPYMVHEKQYAVVPLFTFQQLHAAPQYRHERLREFYSEWAVSEFLSRGAGEKLMRLLRGAFRLFMPSMDGERFTRPFPPIYLSALLLVPLLGAILAARQDRWIAIAFVMLLLFVVALAPLTWLLPHYAAPAAPLLAIVLTAGLMRVSKWRVAVAVFAVVWLASAVVSIAIMRVGQRGAGVWSEASLRASIVQRLTASGEKHVVIVRYPPRSFLHFEWVWNDADINGSPVVWARDMGDNRRLLDSFRERRVWMLDTSVATPRLREMTDDR